MTYYKSLNYLNLLDQESHLIDEVWEVLDPAHCDQCYAWSVGELAWWKDSETIEGQAQIKDILAHYHGRTHAA